MENDFSAALDEPLPEPIGDFVQMKKIGHVVAVSGQLPLKKGKLIATGRVGENVDVTTASMAARICVLNACRAVRLTERSSERSQLKLLRLVVYIACGDREVPIPDIADAASAAAKDFLGAEASSARTAIGVSRLPANAPVEVELTFVENAAKLTKEIQG